jgi:hypothetical protein
MVVLPEIDGSVDIDVSDTANTKKHQQHGKKGRFKTFPYLYK